jgi:putative nucleotidyltransferase with HDIG domain
MADGNSILLVCDDEGIAGELREKLIVEGGYAVTSENTGPGGIEALRRDGFDLVVVKFNLAGYDSSQIVKELKKQDPDAAIIAYMAQDNPALAKELRRLGVYDFITKPLNAEKLFFLIKKGIELHALTLANRKLNQSLSEQNTSLQKQNLLLAKRIEESTKNLSRLYEDLRTTYMRTIKVLAQAIDARDHYTHSHSENVAKYAVVIAEELKLSVKDIEIIREACELHDLGKIGVVDNILGKPSTLTQEEREQIKRHPLIGAQILEPLTFLSDVIDLVREHHENYDGSGYPEGRKGEDIHIGARIIRLADSYEAMTSARAYRKVPLTKEEAIAEIKQSRGKEFDPKVVDAFLRIVDKM